MIDRRILMHSDVYDTWGAFNPAEFAYGQTPEPEMHAFADAKGAACPSEDRAGLLIAAMDSGNRDLFCSTILQNKLRQMCLGIRQVYALSGTLPWEQYLW